MQRINNFHLLQTTSTFTSTNYFFESFFTAVCQKSKKTISFQQTLQDSLKVFSSKLIVFYYYSLKLRLFFTEEKNGLAFWVKKKILVKNFSMVSVFFGGKIHKNLRFFAARDLFEFATLPSKPVYNIKTVIFDSQLTKTVILLLLFKIKLDYL